MLTPPHTLPAPAPVLDKRPCLPPVLRAWRPKTCSKTSRAADVLTWGFAGFAWIRGLGWEVTGLRGSGGVQGLRQVERSPAELSHIHAHGIGKAGEAVPRQSLAQILLDAGGQARPFIDERGV